MQRLNHLTKNLRRLLWRSSQTLLAVITLILLFHPTLHGLAPLTEALGSVGLDGLLLLLEIQFLAWSLPILRHHVIPAVTRRWNRHVALRLGWQPSENIFADATLGSFHLLLCRGGPLGLAVYLTYIGLLCHFMAHAPVVIT